MTVMRMMRIHGVRLSDDDRRAIVKHLADTQGLAPDEAREYRYILERRPPAVEHEDEEMTVMCARCHSYAQIALQRRDEAEWRRLSHFHLGQYPSLEYHSRGRDRNWWEIASGEIPARLAELYPFDTDEWTEWRKNAKADLAGTWRVTGHHPGKGGYEGRADVVRSGTDEYRIAMKIRYAGGETATGRGTAVVYTGYEWRGSLDLGGEKVRQVLAADEDGDSLSGRWFLEDHDSLGADIEAVRVTAADTQVLAVEPPFLKAGSQAKVAIHGIGLSGAPALGDGIRVLGHPEGAGDTITAVIQVEPNATEGSRDVSVGEAKTEALFTVYSEIDALRVEPDFAIGRVGGGGGPIPAVPVQFEAVGYLNGADGEPGTDDDLRVGVLPADWSVTDYNEAARAMKDSEFAGEMKAGGLFVPAAAGPNRKRKFSTNNAGDLTITARANDGGTKLEATSHLIVSVQRWVDPPIR
ncbi:MAG: quinohemoprotein amine dehydrogenase [Candidatus Binatota bacterium]|nr:quinohemoprotein amine dehydrogenase [Candidatus Binatota bacterium]